MSQRRNNIRELASRVVALQEQARSLGLFAGDRELLECPKMWTARGCFDRRRIDNLPPDANGQDTGLRFDELAEGTFNRPACGSIVKEG